MNTRNPSNGRFSLVSSTWLLALALGASGCGAAPDSQGGEPDESTAAPTDEQDSGAGPAEAVPEDPAAVAPAHPGWVGNPPGQVGSAHVRANRVPATP
jgi:hypothetical protein